MSASRAVLVAVGILVVFLAVGWLRLVERTSETTEVEQVAVTEIRIRPGSGAVTVRTVDDAQTRIFSCVRYRGGAPQAVYRLDGTVLTLHTSCGTYCSVSFDVDAPVGVRITGENGSGPLDLSGVSDVDVRTGSGRITVKGASGPVTARSNSGPIHLYGVHGALTAESSSGPVDADGVSSPQARIRTSSGDVNVGLDTPGSVSAESSSGDVRVAVPDGAYRVRTESSTGRVDSHLDDAPDAEHRIELRSSSGDIALTTR